jgi:thiamine pyrophosphate-dependent acetolactate synthase large subunit-like protein
VTTAAVLADAVAELGCTHLFGLMGDGNMTLYTALSRRGVDVVEVRHESAAVSMAEGYAWTSPAGVGFCSVTHGPGLTHTATSLVVAARNHSPLVMLLAETPVGYEGAQRFDQEAFVRACEAPYRRLAADEDPASVLRDCARIATDEGRPVVLAVPAHLFGAAAPAVPSGGGEATERRATEREATPGPAREPGQRAVRRPAPAEDRAAAATLAEALAGAARPVLIAGRGALRGGAAALMTALAERFGAALATTVPGKGLFDGHPLDLGISGGLSHRRAEGVLRSADLVVAVGSSLDRGTTSSMRLFGGAQVLQLVHDADAAAPQHPNVRRLFGNAGAVLEECLSLTAGAAQALPWFTPLPPPAECWLDDFEDFAPVVEAGTVDPRRVLADVSLALPAGSVVITGNGHCSGFAATFVQVPEGGQFFAAHGFGSIGQALTSAVGAALGAPGRKTVVFEGDAAFMMHLAEVETAARAGADLTVFVLNDQALGTEYHRLLAEGDDADLAAVATPDLAAVAAGLGARGTVLSDEADAGRIAGQALAPGLAVVEVRTSRSILSRHMRWIRGASAGSATD